MFFTSSLSISRPSNIFPFTFSCCLLFHAVYGLFSHPFINESHSGRCDVVISRLCILRNCRTTRKLSVRQSYIMNLYELKMSVKFHYHLYELQVFRKAMLYVSSKRFLVFSIITFPSKYSCMYSIVTDRVKSIRLDIVEVLITIESFIFFS